MSNKLCYYRCFVTINDKTEEYGYGLSWKEIQDEVKNKLQNSPNNKDNSIEISKYTNLFNIFRKSYLSLS